MNPELAKRLLGIEPGDEPGDLPALVEARIQEAQARVAAASSEDERQRHATALTEIREAGAELTATFGGLAGTLDGSEATLDGAPGPATTPFEPMPTLDDGGAGQAYGAAVPGTKNDPPVGKLDLRSGTVLAGRYEIRDRIGIGGMGAVFKAFDQDRREEVAVKVPLPGLLNRTVAQERFHSEARLSSALSHPSIVNVFDVQREGQTYFLTMELLQGKNLREAMLLRGRAKELYEVAEVSSIVGRTCEALHYAHQTTVHRDVKPENVFLCEDGSVKLMDFGIARAVSASDLTKTGSSMGTAYYMAPEQLRDSKDVDHRADQYSVGVMLYELLAGFVPAGRHEPLHRLRKDVSKRLSEVVDKALSPRPDARFGTTEDLRLALVSASEGKGPVPGGWRPWAIGGAAAAGLALVLTQLGGDSPIPVGPEPGPSPVPVVSGDALAGVIASLNDEQRAELEQAELAQEVYAQAIKGQPEGFVRHLLGLRRDPKIGYQRALGDLQGGATASALNQLGEATREWRSLAARADTLVEQKAQAEAARGEAEAARGRWETLALEGASAELLGVPGPEAGFEEASGLWAKFDYPGAVLGFERARAGWDAGGAAHHAEQDAQRAAQGVQLDALLASRAFLDSALDEAYALGEESQALGGAFEAGVRLRFSSEPIRAARAALDSADSERAGWLGAADFGQRIAGLEPSSATLRSAAADVQVFVTEWRALLGRNSQVAQLREQLRGLPLDSLGLQPAQLLEPVAAQRSRALPLMRRNEFAKARTQLDGADQLLASVAEARPDLEAAAGGRVAWQAARQSLDAASLELGADPHLTRLATIAAAFDAQDVAAGRSQLASLAELLRVEAALYERVDQAQQRWVAGVAAFEALHPARRTGPAQAGLDESRGIWTAALAGLRGDGDELAAAVSQLESAADRLTAILQTAGSEGPILLTAEPAQGTFLWDAVPEIVLAFDSAPDEVWISGERATLDGNVARATPQLDDLPPEGRIGWRAIGPGGVESSDWLPLVIERTTFEDWAEVVRMRPEPGLLRKWVEKPLIESGLPWRVVEPRSGIELILLPAGRYPRGLSQGDEAGSPDEGPRHSVRVPDPFYMGRTEVTRDQWARVMGTTVEEGTGDLPMTGVTPAEVEDFLGRTGLALPRESEWEFACRAGTTTATPDKLRSQAWNSANAGVSLHPVGGKNPNLYGLHDMLGNAAELCSNAYDPGFFAECVASHAGETPAAFDDTAEGETRAVRGGSFSSTDLECRVSARSQLAPDASDGAVGFRVVRRR